MDYMVKVDYLLIYMWYWRGDKVPFLPVLLCRRYLYSYS